MNFCIENFGSCIQFLIRKKMINYEIVNGIIISGLYSIYFYSTLMKLHDQNIRNDTVHAL